MHQYLKATKSEGEKELSPAELYNKFLERCMKNFHMVTKLPSDTQVCPLQSHYLPSGHA